MKKCLLAIAALFMFASCSKDSVAEPPQKQEAKEVEVTLGYSFVNEVGDMTRSGSTLYNEFYEEYIKTKKLAPPTFDLTFTNKETAAVTNIRGEWGEKHITLLTGEYEVVGKSVPQDDCIDTLFLYFEEDVTITSETQAITLTAKYDSYLLLFNAADKDYINYRYHNPSSSYYTLELKNTGTLYYAFFKEFMFPKDNRISIYRNGVSSTIILDNIPFEKGKYYYFNDVSGSFDIPPMESGN